MSRLVIYGAGGFGRELVYVAEQSHAEIVFADDVNRKSVLGREVISPDAIKPDDKIAIAVASASSRRAIASRFPENEFPLIVDRSYVRGGDVEIGEGSIFMQYSATTTGVRVGRHFHCNGYSFVAHDCVIGDFVTFAPRVSCNGCVHIHDGVQVGAGALIKNGDEGNPLVIGTGAIIGMGAVVTKDVEPGAIMVGNPARVFSRQQLHAVGNG